MRAHHVAYQEVKTVQESEEDDTEIRPDGSRFLRHFGAVTPNRRPEDFKALRDAFERAWLTRCVRR